MTYYKDTRKDGSCLEKLLESFEVYTVLIYKFSRSRRDVCYYQNSPLAGND